MDEESKSRLDALEARIETIAATTEKTSADVASLIEQAAVLPPVVAADTASTAEQLPEQAATVVVPELTPVQPAKRKGIRHGLRHFV